MRQLEAGRAEVENQYSRAVRREGNPGLEATDRGRLRGLRPQMARRRLDPEERLSTPPRISRSTTPSGIFEVDDIETQESTVCISGQVLRGLKKPHECPAFGKECTPQTPLGATMVSAEGACAAYHAYGRHLRSASGVSPRATGSGS